MTSTMTTQTNTLVDIIKHASEAFENQLKEIANSHGCNLDEVRELAGFNVLARKRNKPSSFNALQQREAAKLREARTAGEAEGLFHISDL